MAENADNDSLSSSRVARRAPSKRRASSVSTEGENKLAGVAPSAQQFVQPGEPPRDESTLDLFAGDPFHAPASSAQTDHRQGWFEPQEPSTAEAAQAARTIDGTEAAVAASHDGAQADVVIDAVPRDDGVAGEATAAPEATATMHADSERSAEAITSQTPVLADANGAADDTAATGVAEAATDPLLPGQALSRLRVARAVPAPRPAKGGRAASRAAGGDSAAAAAAALPTPSELNPAQAAFAETIDALHGVIADQRRAAGRMKWLLGAVAGALLVTVVAGAAQTMILLRLADDAGDQQQRVAQMMQDQQAAIAGALARLPAQTEAPAVQAVPQSPAHPAATSPEHHTRHATTHGHHARAASQ
jgi:hypothetical protein